MLETISSFFISQFNYFSQNLISLSLLIIFIVIMIFAVVKSSETSLNEQDIYDLLEDRYGIYDLEETTSGALILKTYNIGEDNEIDSWSEKAFKNEDELLEFLSK